MKKTSRLTQASLLFALCIVLNFLEGQVTAFPAYPGVKLGLSNLPVMFALLCIGFPMASSLAAAKSLFVFITRGFSAATLSFAGGALSIVIMYVLKKALREHISLSTLSVSGAICHNLGQLFACSLLWASTSVFTLSPILIVSGVVFGNVNALLVRATLPYLKRLGDKK